jgi:hypothetical protein
MKRVAPLLLLALTLTLIAAPFAFGATAAQAVARGDRSPVAPVATALSTVTGIAISPLLGTAAYGAFRWMAAKDDVERDHLPWFAQPKFWVPALLIVAACAAKDAFGTALPPGLKKPLDVMETLENKVSGLVAAGAVVPMTMDMFSKLLVNPPATTAVVNTLAAHGFATISFAAIDWHWLLDILTVPFGIAIFALVWLAGHAINVLILLSPWGAIDAALKAGRTALMGLVALTASINPWVGALLSLVVIVIAYFIAGWSFRLTVCGSIFCWDFLTGRRGRFTPDSRDNRVFAGANFPGVPVRTYGRMIAREDGKLDFTYRPWLVLQPRTAVVPVERGSLAVGKGLIFSNVVAADGRTLFLLPPRYRGHESELVRNYALGGGVRDAGLRKAWGAMREMFGGRAVQPPVVAA